jgi:hypothetical protein
VSAMGEIVPKFGTMPPPFYPTGFGCDGLDEIRYQRTPFLRVQATTNAVVRKMRKSTRATSEICSYKIKNTNSCTTTPMSRCRASKEAAGIGGIIPPEVSAPCHAGHCSPPSNSSILSHHQSSGATSRLDSLSSAYSHLQAPAIPHLLHLAWPCNRFDAWWWGMQCSSGRSTPKFSSVGATKRGYCWRE